MSAYIQGIQDGKGNDIYPITKMAGVYDDNGRNLTQREFKITDVSPINTQTATINNSGIYIDSIIDVYYKDNSYDIAPTYTQGDGFLTISFDEIPKTTVEIDAIVVKNI